MYLTGQTIDGGVSVKDPVYYDTTGTPSWKKATSSTNVPNGLYIGSSKVVTSGKTDELSGLTANNYYYLVNGGGISTTPTAIRIGFAISTTELIVDIQFALSTSDNSGISVAGAWTVGSLVADNITIDGNTISSTSGDINITPLGGEDIVLDGHWEFDGPVMTALTDADTTLTAYAGKAIAIEGVKFDGGVVTAASTIYGSTADNGDITIEGTSSATKTTSYVILQPTGGNVAIGGATANQKLSIIQSADADYYAELYHSLASNTRVFGWKLRSLTQDYFIGLGGGSRTDDRQNKLFIHDETAGQTRLTMSTTGAFGIGVNAAAAGAKIDIRGGAILGTDTAATAHRLVITPAGSTDAPLKLGRTVTGGSNQEYLHFYYNSTDAATIGTQYGGIRRNGADNAFEFFNASDSRLKQNIVDWEVDALSKICELRIRDFEWKRNPGTVCHSLIAQEAQLVIPDMVSEGGDGTLNIGYSELNYYFIKAIQQLKALIDAK